MTKPTATKFTIDVDVESEETFSIGDFFILDKYTGVCVIAQVGFGEVAMILIGDGDANRVSEPIWVKNIRNITPREFSLIADLSEADHYTKLKSVNIKATV